MRILSVLVLTLSICGFVTACGSGSEGAAGDPCHDDGECSGDLHCHIDDGAEEGECEADDDDEAAE